MSVDEINIRSLVMIDWLSSCSENSHLPYTKFEPNTSPALFCEKNYSVYSVGTLRSHQSLYLQIFLAHNITTNTKCYEKNNSTSHSTQPNPSHELEDATQHNPTQPMDGPNPWPSLLFWLRVANWRLEIIENASPSARCRLLIEGYNCTVVSRAWRDLYMPTFG